MRQSLIIIFILAAYISIHTSAKAANSVTVTSADKTYTYTLRRDTTWYNIVTSTPLQLFVEGAQQYAINFLPPPTALQSIYTTLQARIFVDHADAQFVPVLTQASANLQAIYSALQARIYVGHADAQFVPVLIPIILDNGVPTGTVARAASHSAQSNLATPTATATVYHATATIQTSTNSSQIYSPTPVLNPIVTPPQATTHTYTAEPATTETATTLIPLPSATATPTSVKQQLNTPTP